MTLEAKIIQCSYEAGLVLVGQGEDGEAEWMGTREQFDTFKDLLEWVDENGSYPWLMPF